MPSDVKHTSFTAWTTRVSNPVCSPRFRASASVSVQSAAFATGVLPNIYEFHLYTGNSTLLSRSLVPPFRAPFPASAQAFPTQHTTPPPPPLPPLTPTNAAPPQHTIRTGPLSVV